MAKKKTLAPFTPLKTIFFGYTNTYIENPSFVSTLNGTHSGQWSQTGRSLYQSDISDYFEDTLLHGLEFGNAYFEEDFYLDWSVGVYYKPLNSWTHDAYPVRLNYISRGILQASIGSHTELLGMILYIGIHAGVTANIAGVRAQDTGYVISTEDSEALPTLEHNNLRGGLKIGLQSGREQGLQLSAALGYSTETDSDFTFSLGYFTHY